MQLDIEAVVDNLKKKDSRMVPLLDKIIAAAGYKTLDEYVKAALERLTPEQREIYNKLREEFEGYDKDTDIAWQVSWGLIAVAAFTRASGWNQTSLLRLMLR
jgi:hypothetical protein